MTLNVEPKRRGSKMEISPVVPTVTEKSYMTQTVTKAAEEGKHKITNIYYNVVTTTRTERWMCLPIPLS